VGDRSALGIDVGGTKVAGILLSETGTILAREERPTPADDVEATMETIYEVAATLAPGGTPEAIGVGAAGMVDFSAGRMRSAPNLAWKEIPIRELVGRRTGLPCLLDNDANAAAWGEYRFGAAQGYRHALMVTVGTGIGGGIITDGRLFRGAHGFAAEIGHIIVEPDGPQCGCGNHGCWEQVASGRALARRGRELAERSKDSPIARLAGDGPVTGKHVSQVARTGDEAALQIFAETGRRLGEGIAGLVNVLDPEIVVIGGGVAEEGELLLAPARHAFADAVEAPEHRPEVPLVPAALGADGGAVGAAALALDEAPARR
jgi:glucokinase